MTEDRRIEFQETVDRLERQIEWFLAHQDEVPNRMHVRDIWHDEGGGSALGSPAWSREFTSWLYARPDTVMLDKYERVCHHPGLEDPRAFCESCGAYDGEGKPLYNTGVVSSVRQVYRWPMRAAMAKMRSAPVREGRPNMATALRLLAMVRGDWRLAAKALARRYPLMAMEKFAVTYFDHALRQLRRRFTEELPVEQMLRPPRRVHSTGPVEKSEAQLNAEARVDTAVPPC